MNKIYLKYSYNILKSFIYRYDWIIHWKHEESDIILKNYNIYDNKMNKIYLKYSYNILKSFIYRYDWIIHWKHEESDIISFKFQKGDDKKTSEKSIIFNRIILILCYHI